MSGVGGKATRDKKACKTATRTLGTRTHTNLVSGEQSTQENENCWTRQWNSSWATDHMWTCDHTSVVLIPSRSTYGSSSITALSMTVNFLVKCIQCIESFPQHRWSPTHRSLDQLLHYEYSKAWNVDDPGFQSTNQTLVEKPSRLVLWLI